MIDEERILFMDWKKKNKDNIENVVITLLNYENGVDTKTCYNEVDWLIQKTFFAGLKAGRLTKWHKVADGDLPKRDERFSTNISIAVIIQDNRFAFYCFDDKKWYFQGVEIGNVIAWCEIPKFEE